MEYLIKKVESGKYVIEYYSNGKLETVEHYAMYDGVPQVQIRQGYTKHPDSL